MQVFAVIIAAALVTISNAAFAVVKPAKTRADLSAKLSSLICSNADLNSPNAAWKLGVFDAQIAGQKIMRQGGGALSTNDLQATAQALADKNNHRGISYGTCPDGSGWVASQPAPQPMYLTNASSLTIPARELAQECQRVRVEFAAASGGKARHIKLPPLKSVRDTLAINLNFLRDGVLSVGCLPKQPSWQGNTTWGLVPVKKGPAAVTPFAKKYTTAAAPEQAKFLAWVNAIRAKEKLPPLQASTNKASIAAAKLLASTQTINHDRVMLQNTANELAQVKVKLVGENRVLGRDSNELYWLLWNSPPHRDMMLTKKANTLSIAIEPQDQRYLAVMMFSAETPAKKTSTKKPAAPTAKKSR